MGKIIYDINKKIVYEKGNSFRPKRTLTKKQGLLLQLLSDNKYHNYEEIMKKVYNLEVEESTEQEKIKIRTLMSRLRKKIKNYKEIDILRNNERTDQALGRYKMKGAVWLE